MDPQRLIFTNKNLNPQLNSEIGLMSETALHHEIHKLMHLINNEFPFQIRCDYETFLSKQSVNSPFGYMISTNYICSSLSGGTHPYPADGKSILRAQHFAVEWPHAAD